MFFLKRVGSDPGRWVLKPVAGHGDKFLDQFGLQNLDDLPGMEDLKAAGLLDKRPAIQTLGARGSLGPATSAHGVPDEDSDEEADLPEPLDPDDGEISALRTCIDPSRAACRRHGMRYEIFVTLWGKSSSKNFLILPFPAS